MPSQNPIPLEKSERRKRRREQFSIVVVLLAMVILANFALKLAKLSSTLPFVNSIFFFGIINLNLILLAVLFFLVFRNLSKLFLERRSGLLGSKLKTKLVASFLSLSIIPTVLLFLISAFYINSTFDKWFSVKVGNTLQASLEITDAYYKNTLRSAQHFAERINEDLREQGAFRDRSKGVPHDLAILRSKYGLDAVEVYWHPLDPRLVVVRDELSPNLFPRLPLESIQKALDGQQVELVQHVGTGDVLRSVIPLRETHSAHLIVGALAVSYHLPLSLVNKVDEISSTFADFKEVNPLKYPVKTTYFVILILITLLVIFAAIWVGLYLAREMTMPLERLAKAVTEVGSGNLDVEITNLGHDEIATVSLAFNQMTADLKENRDRLQSAYASLRSTNEELEEKRRYLEAILANVSAGVCSVHSDFTITTINKSAAGLLGVRSDEALGKSLTSVLSGAFDELLQSIEQVLSGGSKETIFKYLNISEKDSRPPLSLLVTITPLYDSEHRYIGLVLVLDDISHLIKAQREVAWREVARRIAHEIKNPLTPIKLSAQRLQKRYLGKLEENEVFEECTNTIIRQVDELKEMVNEFSQFARFPAANPAPNDLNLAISEVVGLFRQAHKEIEFQFLTDGLIPIFSFDRDQIKRAIINLCDNAVAAMREHGGGIVQISTEFRKDSGMAHIQVADNGPGIPDEVLPMLFEPYFSTKKEGTGLGLAIAKRIVNDHDGYIRANSKKDDTFNTFFTIELPINRTMEVMHGA